MALMMDPAADGVWLVTGTGNNWVLVADGDEVTLVGAGFPRDLRRVLFLLERIGRAPADVRAIVLTHAHPDHIGAAERLRADRGIPVRLFDAEAAHARGGHRAGLGAADPAGRVAAACAGVGAADRARRWGAGRRAHPGRALRGGIGPAGRAGAPGAGPDPRTHQRALRLPPARARRAHRRRCPDDGPPGRAHGRPQLLPQMFNHDEAAALASLQTLAGLTADVVLPGHGPAWRGSPASAVERAGAAHR